LNRFDRIPACVRQTDGHADGHLATAKTALCIASRGNKTIESNLRQKLPSTQTGILQFPSLGGQETELC